MNNKGGVFIDRWVYKIEINFHGPSPATLRASGMSYIKRRPLFSLSLCFLLSGFWSR